MNSDVIRENQNEQDIPVVADIAVFASYTWLLNELDKEGIVNLKADLFGALGKYLAIGGHYSVLPAVIIVDDRCLECEGECLCGCNLPEEGEEPEMPYAVVVSEEYVKEIGADMADTLQKAVDRDVVLTILEKYGLAEDAPDSDPQE